jgi:hypothetical protein
MTEKALQLRGAAPIGDVYAETVEEQIYRLKLEGYAPREIAQFTDKSPEEVEETTIRMAERSRLRLLAELAVGTIIEVDRLDAMHKALWPLASTGVAGAIDRVIEISKERRKLLGLDAPAGIGNQTQEVDLSALSDAEVVEFERLQRKLLEKKKRGRPPKRRTADENIIDADVVGAEGGPEGGGS